MNSGWPLGLLERQIKLPPLVASGRRLDDVAVEEGNVAWVGEARSARPGRGPFVARVSHVRSSGSPKTTTPECNTWCVGHERFIAEAAGIPSLVSKRAD